MSSLKIKKTSALAAFGLFAAALYAYFISQHVFFWRYAHDSSDIHNYIRNFDRLDTFLFYRLNSWVDFFSNEVAFHYLYQSMSHSLGDPLVALQVISAVSVALATYSIFPRVVSSFPVFIFVLHPRLLDLFSSQQRFALAISLFIFILVLNPKWFRMPLIASVAFIHSFFSIIFALTFAFSRLSEKSSTLSKYLLLAACAAFIVVAREFLLLSIGDRRADAHQGAAVGGLYLLMFIGTYFVVFLTNRRIVDEIFGFMFSFVAMLAMLSSIAGFYSERFFSASILLFLAFAARNRVNSLGLIVPVLVLNIILSYHFWIRSMGLGLS